MTRPSPAARAAAGAQIGQLRTSQSSAPARLMPGRHPAVKRRPTDPDPAESVERDPQIVAATSVAFFTPSPVSRTSSGCGGSWVPSGSGVMEIPRQRANEFWKNRPGIGHSVSPGSRRSRRAVSSEARYSREHTADQGIQAGALLLLLSICGRVRWTGTAEASMRKPSDLFMPAGL